MTLYRNAVLRYVVWVDKRNRHHHRIFLDLGSEDVLFSWELKNRADALAIMRKALPLHAAIKPLGKAYRANRFNDAPWVVRSSLHYADRMIAKNDAE